MAAKTKAYEATWESLKTYTVPERYQDAKFGIFIHWGVYSVPAFTNEWYPRNMYLKGSPEYDHHVKTWGPHNKFGYKDFIPMFKAEKFDPARWASLFKKAGAKYVMPVAEHHDGFAMYDRDFRPGTPIMLADSTPSRRNTTSSISATGTCSDACTRPAGNSDAGRDAWRASAPSMRPGSMPARSSNSTSMTAVLPSGSYSSRSAS